MAKRKVTSTRKRSTVKRTTKTVEKQTKVLEQTEQTKERTVSNSELNEMASVIFGGKNPSSVVRGIKVADNREIFDETNIENVKYWHNKMWTWIIDEMTATRRKVTEREFLASPEGPAHGESIRGRSFLCAYNKHMMEINGDEKYTCEYCPANWGGHKCTSPCVRDKYTQQDGLHLAFLKCDSDDVITAISIAQDIRDSIN